MASTAAVLEGEARQDRPYARSWLDVAFDGLVALPGPTWLAWLALLVPSIVLTNSALWLSELRPWGELDPTQLFWGVATWGLAAATHHLRNVAGSAFDAFRPALGDGVADQERVRFEMTTMPARSVLAVTVFSFVVTPLYYVSDPVASQVVGITPIGLIPRLASEGLAGAIVLAILYQAVRQMRLVVRLHAAATAVDPFRPAPLYAFSRLTAQAGIVVVLFNTLGLAANASWMEPTSSAALLALYLPWLGACFGGAIVVFVVPLVGMHRRLEAEKDRFESAAGGRLRSLLVELNEAIDGRATERIDALDRAISALRHEQEVLVRLPTWPWSTGTIRGFGSALLLPIALFLVQRYLSGLLGG